MFTGLVEEVGRVVAVAGSPAGARVTVEAPLVSGDLAPGDSVSVDGACLTATEIAGGRVAFDVVAETLRRTTLGERAVDDAVNLERAMRLGDRLGGHIVQGHVDGVGTVRAAAPDGDGLRLSVEIPPDLGRYVVEKGSIALDGVSLTVAAAPPGRAEVALIPHTIAVTTLGPEREGTRINVEIDALAKYVEALVAPYAPGRTG